MHLIFYPFQKGRHRLALALAIVILILSTTYILSIVATTCMYFYANRLYESIITSNTHSRSDVESVLWLCKAKPIEMKDSKWGSHTVLSNNQICIQYRIFGLDRYPIDIIFENQTNVIKVISSYE